MVIHLPVLVKCEK